LRKRFNKFIYYFIEIIPFDLLLTADNLNICVFSANTKQHEKHLLFWAHFIQPHLCLILHDKLQKIEISIFDFYLKRSSPTSKDQGTFQQLPERHHFLIPVIETKPGEQDTRTGILSGFLSIKIQNFASLFSPTRTASSTNQPLFSIEETASSSIVKPIICACNSCLRCYQLKYNNDTKQALPVSTEIFIERPVRLRANCQFYSEINRFINSLNLIKTSNQKPEELSSADDKQYQTLFDMNICFRTSQLILVAEMEPVTSFSLCLNALSLRLSSQTEANLINFSLEDLQARFSQMDLNERNLIADCSQLFGPFTVNLELGHNPSENEIYLAVDLGSININFSSRLLEMTRKLVEFVVKAVGVNEGNQNDSEKRCAVKNKKLKQEEGLRSPGKPGFILHIDDIRNGSMKYNVVDEAFVRRVLKEAASKKTSENLHLLSHIRLPNVGEILCVDDLNLKGDEAKFVSYVAWQYARRRAIIEFRLFPLPFLGAEKNNEVGLKCYLEYLNEASKKFVILKEFVIREGASTCVIEKASDVKFGEFIW